jgi:hypothetical protein
MRKVLHCVALVAAIGLLATGCGGDSEKSSGGGGSTRSSPPAALRSPRP